MCWLEYIKEIFVFHLLLSGVKCSSTSDFYMIKIPFHIVLKTLLNPLAELISNLGGVFQVEKPSLNHE